ncbi:hypothetical protein [Inquilinus sp. Marseille-Q2685]|uniref:hypothetical protein n=1 Tax=Inquilinus sp. Marseille-Q2685 TaxID=2866581 RepID=UPI001CE4A36F|nr:hypothetical protein [Inquilinus sp. Marseille-Q2685]
MRRISLLALAALALGACSVTVPVAVVPKTGPVMRGTATGSLGGGSFTVTDGKLTCSGEYDALDSSPTLQMPTSCSDGRKGLVTATRDSNMTDGRGVVRLQDGFEAQFVFGKYAQGI